MIFRNGYRVSGSAAVDNRPLTRELHAPSGLWLLFWDPDRNYNPGLLINIVFFRSIGSLITHSRALAVVYYVKRSPAILRLAKQGISFLNETKLS